MGVRYLLDASALYPLVLRLREGLLDHASLFAVLDLTVYEVGNVLWKEHRAGRVRSLQAAAALFQEVFENLTILPLEDGLGEVLELASSEGLTFYDASYLYTARRHGLRLVTEDGDLQAFPESMRLEELLEELGVEAD